MAKLLAEELGHKQIDKAIKPNKLQSKSVKDRQFCTHAYIYEYKLDLSINKRNKSSIKLKTPTNGYNNNRYTHTDIRFTSSKNCSMAICSSGVLLLLHMKFELFRCGHSEQSIGWKLFWQKPFTNKRNMITQSKIHLYPFRIFEFENSKLSWKHK